MKPKTLQRVNDHTWGNGGVTIARWDWETKQRRWHAVWLDIYNAKHEVTAATRAALFASLKPFGMAYKLAQK